MNWQKIESVADAEAMARRRVPPGVFRLFEGGSGANVTCARNERAFREVLFRPNNGISLPEIDSSTTVLGHRIQMPALLAPVGFLRAAHPDGEIAAARAASRAGTIQIVSGVTTTSIEEIVAEATCPVFFQMYYFDGRDQMAPVLDRLRSAGVAGLVLTIDAPVVRRVRREIVYSQRRYTPVGTSWNDIARFAPQALTHPRWVWEMASEGALRFPSIAMAPPQPGRPGGFWADLARVGRQTPTWSDLPWIRRHWDGPIVIKGIVRPDDALRAVAEGVDAIVVSNHGGNELDGVVSSLEVLAPIVDVVNERVEILLDSGVRRGSDVVKALALGARAVLLGRAYLYPLMAAGENGVHRILDLIASEVRETMAFLGVDRACELDPSVLKVPADWNEPSHGSEPSNRTTG